ncbi:brachyurin-like [Rhynchophorus ferrugineus]|uniref:brachyurin-like n=1 Tax=Rhynchophorus ferrugineus TaxID=354439 RepID=UPI003FCE84C8
MVDSSAQIVIMRGIILQKIIFATLVANCFNQEIEDVTPDLFPYQALVGTYYYCSGALVSIQHVITTAHCVDGSEEATVYLGFYAYPLYEKNRNEEQGQIIESKEIIIHDNYMKISSKYFQDVAIVVLSKSAKISLYVQPIDISTETPALGAYARFSGWKANEDNNLQYYPVRLYATDICIFLYGSAFLRSQELCVETLTTSSLDLVGNPLSVNNKLVGLLSHDIDCMSYVTNCLTNTIIINVSQFFTWISEQIGNEISSHNSNSSNIDKFKADKPQLTHIKELRNLLPDSANRIMINNTHHGDQLMLDDVEN